MLGLKPGESAWEAVRSWARVWGPLSSPGGGQNSGFGLCVTLGRSPNFFRHEQLHWGVGVVSPHWQPELNSSPFLCE